MWLFVRHPIPEDVSFWRLLEPNSVLLFLAVFLPLKTNIIITHDHIEQLATLLSSGAVVAV
ncbi:hypothetical protein I7I50_05206 [Histoplasma capsulatum G186AR]|uniref:Uncharacterized protein n=1 Tax=Ajellomyces capsulatus TaxID=5037 RepID=A0A8H8D8I8_AJECA|nr:hypothetical protein I7I52_03464 [Histoplasma capsulatum]QSS75913.1 hypothetical protein I7I50_05206 [Histoplasma capsulatum G186AR]